MSHFSVRGLLSVTAFAAILSSPSASARPDYATFLPAAPVEGMCATCHVSRAGGGARNAFGEDVEATLDEDGPDWSKLFCIDSDGDGRTNGEELGDPCGTWSPGETPERTNRLSAPGDPNDATVASSEEICAGGLPTCEAPRLAGCAAFGADSSAIGGLLLMGLFGFAGSSRRRMRRAARAGMVHSTGL